MRLVGLVLLCLAILGPASSSPCRPEDIWALCQLDVICSFRYRADKLAGIKRAFEFYDLRQWQLPYWPAGWQPAAASGITSPQCDFTGNQTVSAYQSAATTPALSTVMKDVLDAVVRYRDYAEGSAGCPIPKVASCDDLTGQCECSCPGAPPGNADDFCIAMDSCQNSLTNWAIGLGIAGLALALLGLILAFSVTLHGLNVIHDTRHGAPRRRGPRQIGL